MRRHLLLLFLGCVTLLGGAQCPAERFPALNVMLQSELVPGGIDLASYCVSNQAWSVGSVVLGCNNALYTPGMEVEEFLAVTEDEVHDRVESFWMGHADFDRADFLLLLNCEQPIHVKDWGQYNDDPAFQNQIFEAMKMRVDIFRSYFPNATIALGPSMRGQAEGRYGEAIFERIEGLQRAGEYGVFDSCSCFEPRMFLSYGPGDGPEWIAWTLAMTEQALDVSSDLTNSAGLSLPLCVTSSFLVFNGDSVHDGQYVSAAADIQLLRVLTYPNVHSISWWAGDFDEDDQLAFLAEIDPCLVAP